MIQSNFLSTNNYIILVLIILLVACSPKLGEINSKSINYSRFINDLQDLHPEYFQRNTRVIEGKLTDWKRLKTVFVEYLDNQAILFEVKNDSYEKTISNKEKKLYYLGTLGDFTQKMIRKDPAFRKDKITQPDISLNKDILKKLSSDGNSDKLANQDLIILKNDIKLSWNDLKMIFPKNKDLNSFIKKQLIPGLEYAMIGKQMAYQNNKIFIKFWDMKWKYFLIRSMIQNKKLIYKKKILQNEEDKLKKYYNDHKNKYLMYIPKKNEAHKEQDNQRDKYQFSFSRVKEDIANQFAEKEIIIWKKKLWKKYSIKVDETYFKSEENKEMRNLQK